MRQCHDYPAVEYAELSPPDELRHLAKVGWTLLVPDMGSRWVSHLATPDGCMEIIRRVDGRSQWKGEQPPCFVAGVITRPASLKLGSGSRFVALRIWPWTWRAISGRSPAELRDRWAPLPPTLSAFAAAESVDEMFGALAPIALADSQRETIEAVLSAGTCRDMSMRAALSPRQLQRWFQRNVGQPPRSYLRLLRFGDALAGLPATRHGLATHALDHGFADQAHMAREFRTLAGTRATQARNQGQGPFIQPFAKRG